jgi:hypothetical protein
VSSVVATRHGRWVVADIFASRHVKKALRDAIHPSKIVPEDAHRWLIHEAAWPAACAVFWYFQMPIEQDFEAQAAPTPPTPLFPGPDGTPNTEAQRVRAWRPWRMRAIA